MISLFFSVGGSEIAFIVFVIVLVFGADKVPEIARNLGKGIRMIKNATNDIKHEVTKSAEEQFDGSGFEDVKDEVNKVKDDINDITGSIKRQNF